MNRFTSRLMIIPLLPTAARAWSESNFPTTATSTELKDCCKAPLAISGSAKIIIFLNMPPESISIFNEVLSIVVSYHRLNRYPAEISRLATFVTKVCSLSYMRVDRIWPIAPAKKWPLFHTTDSRRLLLRPKLVFFLELVFMYPRFMPNVE